MPSEETLKYLGDSNYYDNDFAGFKPGKTTIEKLKDAAGYEIEYPNPKCMPSNILIGSEEIIKNCASKEQPKAIAGLNCTYKPDFEDIEIDSPVTLGGSSTIEATITIEEGTIDAATLYLSDQHTSVGAMAQSGDEYSITIDNTVLDSVGTFNFVIEVEYTDSKQNTRTVLSSVFSIVVA
jgi:hypothetical protein